MEISDFYVIFVVENETDMKTDKELYQIFEVDTCTQSYAMEYTLIGAVDLDDLIKHLPDILKEMGKSYNERRQMMKDFKEWPPKEIGGAYTDTPYKALSCYGYYE